MPTFSSLVPGVILIHKTTLLTKIYNSSLYHIDECTCREERIHCRRGLLAHSLSKSPEPQELQFLLKLSSIDEVLRYLWSEEGELSSLLNPILLYWLWKWTSTLTGKWLLETHLPSILILRLLLAQQSQPRWLEAQATTCQQRFFCILSVVKWWLVRMSCTALAIPAWTQTGIANL